MPKTSDLGQARLQGAIYNAADNRKDNCAHCVYSNVGPQGRDHWCRLHAAPVTGGSVCAMQEQPKTKKWVAA